MWPVSARFIEALGAFHRVTVRVDAYRGGVLLGEADGIPAQWVQDGLPVADGEVTIDVNSQVRRTLSITLSDPALNPSDSTSPLAPYGTELLVKRGIVYPSGEIEYAPLIMARVDDTEGEETVGGVRFTAPDRSRTVADAKFLTPTSSIIANTVPEEIARLINDALPGVSVGDMTGVTTTAPAVVWEEDRWKAIEDLAESIGAEVVFTPLGDAEIRPVPTIDDPPVQWQINVGDGGSYISSTRRLSREGVYNGVVAMGERTDDTTPVYALVTDNETTSPTYWEGPFGQVPYFYRSPLLTTVAQAEIAATTLLARKRLFVRERTFVCVPNGAVDGSDVIHATLPSGTAERHIVMRATVPLGPSPMQVTGRTSRAED